MSHLIKIYAVCNFSYFHLWYLNSYVKHERALLSNMFRKYYKFRITMYVFARVSWIKQYKADNAYHQAFVESKTELTKPVRVQDNLPHYRIFLTKTPQSEADANARITAIALPEPSMLFYQLTTS